MVFKDVILPIITLIIGTGLLTNIIMSYRNQKNSISIKVVEQYFKAREDICAKLCELANISSNNRIDENKIDYYKNEISNLYYKYYDILPKEVLFDLNCLFTCLSDRDGNIYRIYDDKLYRVENCNDLENFLEKISLVKNFKYVAIPLVKSEDIYVRKSACINYQARGVLRSMNDFFTIEKFLQWDKYLAKKQKT